MAKPKTDNEKIEVRLPAATVSRLNAIVGSYQRPKFLRAAIEGAIDAAEIALNNPPKSDD